MHLYSEPNHYKDYKCIHKKFLYGFYTGTKFKWVFNRNLADHPLVKQLKNQTKRSHALWFDDQS